MLVAARCPAAQHLQLPDGVCSKRAAMPAVTSHGDGCEPGIAAPPGAGGAERGRCQAGAAACRGCVAAVLGLCKHRSPGAVCSQGGRANAAICWRSRSAAGPGKTPALLEPGPAPQPSAGTAAATAPLWGLSVPCGFAPSRMLLRSPRVLGTPRVQPFSACSSWRQSPPPCPHIWMDGQPVWTPLGQSWRRPRGAGEPPAPSPCQRLHLQSCVRLFLHLNPCFEQ